MRTSIVIGLDLVLANMRNASHNQIPFAASLALNQTARDVMGAESKHVTAVFDKPKPFTRNAFGMTPSNKQNLVATVFAKDAQNKYLFRQDEGGNRGLKTFEQKFAAMGGGKVVLPGKGMKLDRYGNITRAQIKRIAADLNSSGGAKRFFKGVPRGGKHPEGVFARVNNNTGLQTMLVFATDATYEKRFNFSAIAQATVTDRYVSNVLAAWNRAVSSAKK